MLGRTSFKKNFQRASFQSQCLLTMLAYWSLYLLLLQCIEEEQCMFRQGRGCMDQVVAVRQVCEKYLANGKDVFWAFTRIIKRVHRVTPDFIQHTQNCNRSTMSNVTLQHTPQLGAGHH